MKSLRTALHINQLEEAIYEFTPRPLSWWDDQQDTLLEVEIQALDKETWVVAMMLAPDVDDPNAERVLVFTAEFSGEAWTSEALVVRELGDRLLPNHSLHFSTEEGGYEVADVDQISTLLRGIFALFPQTQPPVAYSLEEDEETMESPKPGDHLGGLLMNMSLNGVDFEKESVKKLLEMGVKTEGEALIAALKADLQQADLKRLCEEHGLSQGQLDLLRQAIMEF